MKTYFLYFIGLLLIFTSCNADISIPVDSVSNSEIRINILNHGTKGGAYIDEVEYETVVNSVQVLVFDESGVLCAYKNAGKTISDIIITTTVGPKEIWAVVNGPDLSQVKDVYSLDEIDLRLDDQSITHSKGFPMTGHSRYVVGTSNGGEVMVSVSRLLSRIAFRSITNATPISYGEMEILYAFLQNVVVNGSLSGFPFSQTIWCNKSGRNNAGDILDGLTSVAEHPALTFAAINKSIFSGSVLEPGIPYLFYCYPNSVYEHSFNKEWCERKTALTVAARFKNIDNTIRYYTIVLPDMAEGILMGNTTYTVDLTVTGLGQDDPCDSTVKKDSFAEIKIEPWIEGGIINEVM